MNPSWVSPSADQTPLNRSLLVVNALTKGTRNKDLLFKAATAWRITRGNMNLTPGWHRVYHTQVNAELTKTSPKELCQRPLNIASDFIV